MKRAYADIPEGQIHYRTEGSGEPVLLLHVAGSSSDEYKRVIPFLSKTYHAIAMDFPGYGESDKPPYEYQIPDYARSVVSFMDSLGIEKASIVGHHAGASVAAELAVAWPQRVDRLVLSSYPYYRDDNEQLARRKHPYYQRVEISADGSHLVEWWRRAAKHGDPADIVEERALDLHKAGPRGEELHWATWAHGPKLKRMLPLIKCPTLVLSGTLDKWPQFCPSAPEVHRLIPRSRMTIIENGPAYIGRVMPKEFAEAILAFLGNPDL